MVAKSLHSVNSILDSINSLLPHSLISFLFRRTEKQENRKTEKPAFDEPHWESLFGLPAMSF